MKTFRAVSVCATTLFVTWATPTIGAQPAGAIKIDPGHVSEASIEHHGATRTFNYYVPKNFSSKAMHPLILIFGGMGQSLQDVVPQNYTMQGKADADGTVLLYLAPQASGINSERAILEIEEDISFARRVLDVFTKKMRIDPNRIYSTGGSLGGLITFRLACAMPERFAAIAPSVMTIPVSHLGLCQHAAPMPVMITNGTEDPAFPFAGRTQAFDGPGNLYRLLGAEESINYWKYRNHLIDSVPVEIALDDRVAEIFRGQQMPTQIIRYIWSSAEGNDIVWLKIVGGGHWIPMWFDGKSVDPAAFFGGGDQSTWGPVNNDYDGAGAIYDFLLAHKRKSLQR